MIGSNGRMILVIDDETSFGSVVGEILQIEGYNVQVAHSAQQAFAILRAETPALILTDVMMPDMDGLSLIRRLRSQRAWSKIPTVVLSAKGTPQDIDAARRAGADAYLPKPFSVAQLREVIRPYLPTSTQSTD
jgi:DNA-binding response OmpR family regulator